MNIRFILLIAMLNTNLPSLFSQVVQFVESFDGDGIHASSDGSIKGLDNPGWSVSGRNADYTQVESGLRFDLSGPSEEEYVKLERVTNGRGSFVETIKVEDSALSSFCEIPADCVGSGGLLLRRTLGSSFADELTVSLNRTLSDPFINMRIGQFSIQGGFVPIGPNILLAIEFDQSLAQVTVAYDHNLDDDVPSILFGPFEYEGEVSEVQSTAFTISKEREYVVQGTLVHWSQLRNQNLLPGDFNKNGVFDIEDLDLLIAEIRAETNSGEFNLNVDNVVDRFDQFIWVHDIKGTFLGDSNLDGEFNSTDLVSVFQSAQYEDDIEFNSNWRTGDWNSDGDFTSRDLVVAFADGGYEVGPQILHKVPEPSSLSVFSLIYLLLIVRFKLGNNGEVAHGLLK